MTTLFGIKNCDTVKKARRWLDSEGIHYDFHDFRVDGITPHQITSWIATLGLEKLINKRSTTWKALTDKDKKAINDQTMSEDKILSLITEQPTLIKRPLLQIADDCYVGFNIDSYQLIFK